MSIRSELKRKALHLTGLTVPAIYLCCGKTTTLAFIGLAFVLFVVLEPFRIIEEWRDRIKYRLLNMYPSPELGRSIELIENHIEAITRPHERERVAAHIYFAAASFIVVYFFPMKVAVGAITVATLGDALAAIIGKSLGRHRFSSGKSLEGSLAYFLTALLVLIPLVSFAPALAGAVIGTIVEFYNVPPDDNFSNQLAVAVAVYLVFLVS
ncbi:cytidylyltransferase [Thermococcus kodakarensis KOD1]|uniref:Cytidylyltransferase n=1 Tax=Thermococcus kodakarensis (strain ATCC BAA-918 / JCM 12380 / KOD1) TaxID=69014 RepID=Q5JJ86_THEKO|nr:diacylglycerol/polyprenol kinase family protein [Thermococcus kodakarensis]WCN27719.1 SEC59/DGK1/VTE5 family protein [Thermococcus kodakarensis]WCN30012.1 SEC59/DGK1/VTE5 family protein [Thermococcus kodakarensis]BAD85999.1 cytidylyltransferase [Thermococcus kodakarensis KOD1]